MPIQKIAFRVHGDKVVGNLHLPEGLGPHAAVIVGGPMTSVKEQVAGVYAKAIAERGFAALALDHRYYGQSEGNPRQYEKYCDKIEDLKEGLNFLATHQEIDADRLGSVGICLGAGYAFWASVNNARVKAIGAVVGYYRDVEAMKAENLEAFQAKVDQGRAARELYERTGDVITIPAAALEGDAAMTLASTYDYYATPRADVPNYTNSFAVMSREHFLPFDVQSAASKISAPTLMLHSENGLSPKWAKSFFDKLESPKQLAWLDGPDQTAFYDDPTLVEQATDLLVAHLKASLE
ncbi:MAG: dienelactone hydrolase family protein [Pseudomonadota bacterium]